jgi:hypothetical protein
MLFVIPKFPLLEFICDLGCLRAAPPCGWKAGVYSLLILQ